MTLSDADASVTMLCHLCWRDATFSRQIIAALFDQVCVCVCCVCCVLIAAVYRSPSST
jgi:hypothetical protein